MSAWVKEHFRDAQNARETLAKVVSAVAVFGFSLVMLGLWLS